MINHGHVTPNADGNKARCGGPGICARCSSEYFEKYGKTFSNKEVAATYPDAVLDQMIVACPNCGHKLKLEVS